MSDQHGLASIHTDHAGQYVAVCVCGRSLPPQPSERDAQSVMYAHRMYYLLQERKRNPLW